MPKQELMTKARTMGSARVAELTGVTGDIASRWLAGAVNPDLERAFRAAVEKH